MTWGVSLASQRIDKNKERREFVYVCYFDRTLKWKLVYPFHWLARNVSGEIIQTMKLIDEQVARNVFFSEFA